MQFLHRPHPHPHFHSLSSATAISPLSLLPKLSSLSLSLSFRRPTTIIRMGGGPRTYPGGVSKWQWKRMQAKKAKQLLKARLTRERHIYEMRKRAELKAAIADLERPWEVVERAAPKSALFSVSTDEQLKVLADRFQKPGGFDLWSEDDGPQLFETPDGLPTARFFPKGVVHSVKPYGRIVSDDRSQENGDFDGSPNGVGSRNSRGSRNGRNSSKFGSDTEESDGGNSSNSGLTVNSRFGDGVSNGRDVRNLTSREHRGNFRDSQGVDSSLNGVGSRNTRGGRSVMNSRRRTRGGKLGNGSFARGSEKSGDENSDNSVLKPSYSGRKESDQQWVNNRRGGGTRVDGNRKAFRSRDENRAKLKDLEGRQRGFSMSSNGRKWSSREGNMGRLWDTHSEDVYNMSLQRDGSYGFSASDEGDKLSSKSRSTT